MSMLAYNDESKILSIVVPVSFKRRHSRKTIVSPTGKNIQAITNVEGPKQDHVFVSSLIKAFDWQEKLDSGKYKTPKELAEKEDIEPTHMYRIMRLTLLPQRTQSLLFGSLLLLFCHPSQSLSLPSLRATIRSVAIHTFYGLLRRYTSRNDRLCASVVSLFLKNHNQPSIFRVY